jgi:uncharacterized repeat protein (TIGR03803 family)
VLNRYHSGNRALRYVPTIAVVLLLVALPGVASAYTQQTLHSFCALANCADGEVPNGLLGDASGNLYGTTYYGGKYGAGVVFKLVPNQDKSSYTEHIIHTFCRMANCPDGALPMGDLIMDGGGNVYGTASGGGRFGVGAIFKMKPGANGWTYAVLHSFCKEINCTDGSAPTAGLSYQGQTTGALWNGSSPLFGVAFLGGSNNNGVVYELTTNGTSWTYKVIHTFKSSGQPQPVLTDTGGNLFGTTAIGGAYGGGLLYRLAAGTWKETTLHNFCEFDSCSDGTGPQGKLIIDAAGDIFGVTPMGGEVVNCGDELGCGLVFERPAGGGYEVIYVFCSLANCTDGANPYGGLTMDSSGNLFGTTFNGGVIFYNAGVVFKLGSDGAESVLYQFCPNGGSCTDGQAPDTQLILDSQGDLFGTTHFGGANGDYGTVFVLKP